MESHSITRCRVLLISNHREVKEHQRSAGIFVERQVASLTNAGIDVNVFDIGASHSPVRVFKKWIQLRREVRTFNPHLLHGRYGALTGFISVFAGRPAVVTFCGSDLNRGASTSGLRMRLGFVLSNLAALRARRIICVSQQLREVLWWRRGKAVVIPDGVDTDLFCPGSQNEARKELGWNTERPVVLFNIGNDARKKGFDLAKDAMAVVRLAVPGAQLQVVQEVDPSRMPTYYRAADALLCTSLNEGSPNVVKEALACNLPVVSVPVGDVSERLAAVRPSAVVPRDPNAIAKALAEILLTRERSNGREHVIHLGLNEIAERVIAVYRSVWEVAALKSAKANTSGELRKAVLESRRYPYDRR